MRRTTADRSWLLQPVEDIEASSPFANDPMTYLWQDADGHETGAEAVEALRQRKRQEAETASRHHPAGGVAENI